MKNAYISVNFKENYNKKIIIISNCQNPFNKLQLSNGFIKFTKTTIKIDFKSNGLKINK